MYKWYQEEYVFTIEVTRFLRGNQTQGYCRNGEEIGDVYTCTLWLSGQSKGAGSMLESNVIAVSVYGSYEKWR